MIKLYHYSNEDLKILNPAFFGNNYYTRSSQRQSGVKRLYFYLRPDQKEAFFNGAQFCYIVNINEAKLYNLNEDKLKLNDKPEDIFWNVKKRGYKGLIGSNGYPCAVLFYKTRPDKKVRLQ